MRIRLLLLVLLALCAAPLAPAQESEEEVGPSPDLFDDEDNGDDGGRVFYSLGVRGGPWLGLLDGKVRYPVTFLSTPLGDIGGRVTADIRDEDLVMPFGEVFLTLKYLAVYADVWRGKFEDDTEVEADFEFEGTTFSATAPVRGELEVLSAGGRMQINPIALEFLEIGASFGARYFRADGELSGEAPGGQRVSESRRVEAPIPQVGLSVTIFLGDLLDIYARARGLSVRFQDYDVRTLEGEIGLALNLGDHFSIGAEYRALYLELDDRRDNDVSDELDRANIDLALHGPLFYLRLRF